jgi:uncharacterized repeat protein (TIGR01451 family)
MGILITLVWSSPPVRAESHGTCEQVSLVLDESGSIGASEVVVRQALHAFLDPLAGYSLDTSIVEFGTSAATVFGYTEINEVNLGSVFDPYVDNTTSPGYDSPSQLGAWTNWDDALDEVSQMTDTPDLVIFITDGDPTAYNQDQLGEPGGTLSNADTTEATNRALEEATQIRDAGSDIIAIAVGNALAESGDSLSRLRTVVGGEHEYPDDGPLDLALTDIVRVPDFGDLPETLALIAQEMCADPGISVEKNVDQATVTVGSSVNYEIVVTNTGSGPLLNVELSDPLIPECSATIGELEEGESTTVTCTATLWGPMTNTATATAEDPFGTPVSDDGSATVGIIAPGTGTPGYWKNHADAWPMIADSIYIGDWNHNWQCDPTETCLELSSEEALEALSTPPKGDMTWNLARALTAAWLNVSSGNEASCIAATIDQATAWLIDHGLGGDVGGGDPAWAQASGWAAELDDYNNGLLCAEHRDAGDSEPETTTNEEPGFDSNDAKEPKPSEIEEQGPASPNGKGKAKGRG